MKSDLKRTTITMKDVAEIAKVSTATVSRALKKPEKVSATTRQKVKQAATQIGYFPHVLTRNSKYTDSRIILVIVPNNSEPFLNEIIQGIEVTAAQKGYLILIMNYAHQIEQESYLMNLILTRQISGMILLCSQIPFIISGKQQHLPPMVMANEFVPELGLPTVHIDNLTAAFEAVNHLYQLGHRRIACITGPRKRLLCQYRLQGYIQALQRNNLKVLPEYIVSGDFTFESGAAALKQLMTLPCPPSALFCHSDIIAMGVISQAKRFGLSVPKNLSLVGFDDIEAACYSTPKLTTVAPPHFNIGREAIELLIKQVQGKIVSGNSYLLDFELKLRDSSTYYTS